MEAKKPRTKEAKVVLNEKFDNKELVNWHIYSIIPSFIIIIVQPKIIPSRLSY
jgi:hypothetical protein